MGTVAIPLSEDVTSVAYSPSFPIDQAIIAVSSTAAGTFVHVKVFTNDWDAPSYYPATLAVAPTDMGLAGTDIASSSLVLPTDFNAANAATRYLYFSTNSGTATNDDVYRVYLTPGSTTTTPVALGYAAPKVSINNLAYSGNTASGALYAGATATATFKYTTTPTAAILTWIPGGVLTGALNAYVAVNGATVYVGTTGAESAFNVSMNSGANFVQVGYIDTTITTVVDFQAASATEWYMVTQRAATNNSLWKTVDGGATWVRIEVLVGSTAANPAGVRLSPAFATDHTMYIFEKGATAGAPNLLMSSDSGATWTQHWFDTALSAVGVNDLVVVDAYSMYAASCAVGTVYKTSNNGFWWTAQALTGATGSAVQLKYDVASGDVLAGMSNGVAYLSTDGINWLGIGGPALATGAVNVAFDASYATNSVVYADSIVGSATVARWDNSAPALGWVDLAIIPATFAGEILVTPDGVLYATDMQPAAVDNPVTPLVDETAGGVVRILAPTTGSALLGPTYEQVTSYDGLALLSTLSTLSYAAGSNILYSIDTATNTILTYTDTLSTAVPAIVTPAVGDVLLAPAPSVIITPVTGALNYELRWNTREDFLGTGAAGVVFVPFPTNGFVLAGVPAGSMIYYQVRVIAPVLGPWSQMYSFQTQLVDAPTPNSPVIVAQVTANGGINAPVKPVFLWQIVTGATGYEFQLAKDYAMTDLVVDATGANALGTDTSYELATALDYGTPYYWKVRAISATSFTSWSEVQAFTTMAAPTTPPPAVTVEPNPPDTIILPTPTVILPTPTTTEITKQINPSYIWAIIIIGAVLVLAVIVLIVRTRRTV
ncbi:MAG: YCF48-related protein [Dehalococcoidales bacterium]